MTKINIDTTKMRDAANDLLFSSKSYMSNIDSLYDDTIKKMPDERVWYGHAANIYVRETQKQKVVLEKHADSSLKLAKTLINYVDALESAVKTNILK